MVKNVILKSKTYIRNINVDIHDESQRVTNLKGISRKLGLV